MKLYKIAFGRVVEGMSRDWRNFFVYLLILLLVFSGLFYIITYL